MVEELELDVVGRVEVDFVGPVAVLAADFVDVDLVGPVVVLVDVDFVGLAVAVAAVGSRASWIIARITLKSGLPGLMFWMVKVSDLMLALWIRRTSSIHAGRSSASMLVVMLFFATWARAGYFWSIETGLTWSRILPTRQRWRRIRL